jgi:hypothetical protein
MCCTLAIISCIRSSWDSISRKVLIWLMVRFSRYPRVTSSSKALRSSYAFLRISRSSRVLQVLVTT